MDTDHVVVWHYANFCFSQSIRRRSGLSTMLGCDWLFTLTAHNHSSIACSFEKLVLFKRHHKGLLKIHFANCFYFFYIKKVIIKVWSAFSPTLQKENYTITRLHSGSIDIAV